MRAASHTPDRPATISESRGVPGVRGDEPWVDELFERRQSVQSTLFELERQAALVHRSDR